MPEDQFRIVSRRTSTSTPEVVPAATWKTFYSKAIGMRFSYPPEYCVGMFSKEDLYNLGELDDVEINDPQSRNYVIVMRDDPNIESPDPNLIPPCSTAFGPEGFFLYIDIFSNNGAEPLSRRVPSDVRVFSLPPMTISGVPAIRFLEGGGGPDKGAPFYDIVFKKGHFTFVLSAGVGSCTAENGTCDAQGQESIKLIDAIVRTIQFDP